MKFGVATSVSLHVLALGIGLVSLRAPAPLDAGASEALPVSIVPVEELTQMIEGDKTASLKEAPAPKPTTKPETKPDAVETGDNDLDLKTPPTPEARPKEVKAAAAPPPAPEPLPKPVVEPEQKPAPEPEPKPKPEPVPATEVKPEPAPKEDVKPEATPETAVAEAVPDAEVIKLPDSAPSPEAKPKPPEAQTAKTPDRKEAEKPQKEAAQKPKSDEKQFDADEVAMLLDKQKASGGGAKRSTKEASLGGKKTTGAKLSQGEMDALRGQLSGCWSIPAGMEGAEGLRVSVRFNLDASGKLEGRPAIDASSGDSIFDQSAVRAVQKCDHQGFALPMDKADTWSEVVVNFDPSEMF